VCAAEAGAAFICDPSVIVMSSALLARTVIAGWHVLEVCKYDDEGWVPQVVQGADGEGSSTNIL
jgi:hypothetical protein